MADNTSIEWADATWNPIRARVKEDMIIRGHEVLAGKWGYHCERFSPGCLNCYAATMNKRMLPAWGTGLDYAVPNREKVEIFLDETELLKPLKWKKSRRIFVESMSDWCATFVTDEMRDRIMAVAALCPQHTFLCLTKRAKECTEYFLNVERPKLDFADSRAESIMDEMRSLGIDVAALRWPLPNVHLGFSAENQECFDERWSHMRQLAAAGWKVWCSAEPLLANIDIGYAVSGLNPHWTGRAGDDPRSPMLHQVVVGGESGPGARPCNIDWIRGIMRQCRDAGVAVFVKQMGAKPMRKMGIHGALELKAFAGTSIDRLYSMKLNNRKGSDPSEWPEDLRVREVPMGQHDNSTEHDRHSHTSASIISMPNKSTTVVRTAAARRSAPKPHTSGITKSYDAGRIQALAGMVYNPPIWIRQSLLYCCAFQRGYQSVPVGNHPSQRRHPSIL